MEKTSCFSLNDWNYEELEILKTYYPREGAYVCKRLKEKSPISCIEIAKYLKLKMNGTRIPSVSMGSEDTQEDFPIAYWTQEEIKILEEYYPKEGKNVSNRLPNRTGIACKMKAKNLKLRTYRGWTEEEINILKTYYPKEGTAVSNRLKYKDENSCRYRAKMLGFHYKSIWTEEEIECLISCGIDNTDKLVEMFPNRTLNACREKYYNVYNERYGTWSQRERLILTEFYPIEGIEVAKRFKNKIPDACLYEADRLGLKKKKKVELFI